jgi:vancomycin permeability regulator SanA
MKQKNVFFIRVLLFLVAIIGFIWFFLPLTLSVQLNIGNATGMVVAVLLFVYAIFMTQIHRMVRQWKREKKWLYFSMFGILFFIIALVVLESICMLRAATKTPDLKATVVVLGCRVYGERASLSLQERLEAAYEYLLEQEEAVCVLSGGQGDGEDISESECMYRYLIAKGIASERLYKE